MMRAFGHSVLPRIGRFGWISFDIDLSNNNPVRFSISKTLSATGKSTLQRFGTFFVFADKNERGGITSRFNVLNFDDINVGKSSGWELVNILCDILIGCHYTGAKALCCCKSVVARPGVP
jgi:hypothetical protein